jgi:fused signal recognition particle receptor
MFIGRILSTVSFPDLLDPYKQDLLPLINTAGISLVALSLSILVLLASVLFLVTRYQGKRIRTIQEKDLPKKSVESATALEDDKHSLRKGLQKTRSGFIDRIKQILQGEPTLNDELEEQLEEILYTADIGVKTSQYLMDIVKNAISTTDGDENDALDILKVASRKILNQHDRPLKIGQQKPHIVLIIGVNGVGKTTSIGKLASRFLSQGNTVAMVAGDTFRAAAKEQLQIWGMRVGCSVYAGNEGSDPSAVIFDGLHEAIEEGVDLILIDTAGRLHTKVNLVNELKKIRRICDKVAPGSPHDTLLVLDSNTGQNAIQQAQMFRDEVGVTGLVLTKLDGTAKGGVVIGICDELELPIQFIGIGEKVEDLKPFSPDDFVDALFSSP